MAAMIRSAEDLAAALAAKRAVTLQGLFEGAGLRLVMEDTNETVNRRALAICVRDGKARLIQSDLAGEPYRWVAA
jgi:hypothetical protein